MIKIMADLAADIPGELVKKHNIEILPFYINTPTESILAGESFTPDMFYEKFGGADEMPSTSQATPEILEAMYREAGKNQTPVIHITISGSGSGIFNTARLVSEQLREEGYNITIVDSRTYSYAIGANVVEAAKMSEAGKSAEEIVAFLEERFREDSVYFIVDDLKYLQKGGRIKATTMVISKVLDIKPILKSSDGLVEAFAKVRGSKKAISKLVDIAEEKIADAQNATVYILHSNAPDKADILTEMVKERINPKAIERIKVGPIISCHAGIGVFGIYFKHKPL